jgi:hypothetical protein
LVGKAKRERALAKRGLELQRLRARWDIHTSSLPPNPSSDPRAVEFRAKVAEEDVRLGRFIDALAAGHADGLTAPEPSLELTVEMGLLLADGVVGRDEGAWSVRESAAVKRLLEDAKRLQRSP